ncbi:hypothetical protein THRCLA_09428 [Thraustotheca clavata]|uniref:Chromosome segregation in meiosis protein 3 domain-containing protein n=1 Tax=Thraustotheca clavata TaxID=74557 RepID=A0A1V9YWE4_9STRA|nr:hypothetical protein THRCLA_09428 [Thraustotheca clavata]
MASWEDGDRILSRNTPVDIASRKRPADEALEDNGEEDGAPVETEENKEEAVVKPKKKRNVFSDQHLLSNEGFRKVYETFPKHFTQPVPAGMEAMALRDLMTCYKEWAFDLYPKLAFEDFVERTEVLAKKAAVGELLQELRATEAKRDEPEPDFTSIIGNPPSTRINTDTDPTEQEMQDILEYEAMIASMRQESASTTTNHSVQPQEAAKEADLSDGEAEFDYQPAKLAYPNKTQEPKAIDESAMGNVEEANMNKAIDEPALEIHEETSKNNDIDEPAMEEETSKDDEASTEPVENEASKPFSPIEATQEEEEELDLPSDNEAQDVMEYEARTSLLRDMVEKPSGRLPRASEALNEAATLLEEESDSDSDIEFPSTRFGSMSQATQPDDLITK